MQILIKVFPKSKQNKVEPVATLFGTSFKVYTNAPPEDGKANAAVIALLAKYFKTAKSNIAIIKGQHARNKVCEIHDPHEI